MRLTFPPRINREIVKHQTPGGNFQPVAVLVQDDEKRQIPAGTIIRLEWQIPIKLSEQIFRHEIKRTNGVSWESFYRVTRVGVVNFMVERLRWRLDRRAVSDLTDEHEINTMTETVEFKSGTWSASEFTRWYATGSTTINKLTAGEYQSIINQFLTVILDGKTAAKRAINKFQQ